MIVVRNIFQAKYGRGDELVALLKELGHLAGERLPRSRVLTDLSGPFFTVISEVKVESLAAWEQMQRESFGDRRFEEWFGRTVPLIESGRREFFRIEE